MLVLSIIVTESSSWSSWAAAVWISARIRAQRPAAYQRRKRRII